MWMNANKIVEAAERACCLCNADGKPFHIAWNRPVVAGICAYNRPGTVPDGIYGATGFFGRTI